MKHDFRAVLYSVKLYPAVILSIILLQLQNSLHWIHQLLCYNLLYVFQAILLWYGLNKSYPMWTSLRVGIKLLSGKAFGIQPWQHTQARRLVPNAQNVHRGLTLQFQGMKLSLAHFSLPFDCWHFWRSPPPVVHKFSCLCLLSKLLACSKRRWWFLFPLKCCDIQCLYALLSHTRGMTPPLLVASQIDGFDKWQWRNWCTITFNALSWGNTGWFVRINKAKFIKTLDYINCQSNPIACISVAFMKLHQRWLNWFSVRFTIASP